VSIKNAALDMARRSEACVLRSLHRHCRARHHHQLMMEESEKNDDRNWNS
jgi:hypothetical protein